MLQCYVESSRIIKTARKKSWK